MFLILLKYRKVFLLQHVQPRWQIINKFCSAVCDRNFSLAAGGVDEVHPHSETKTHRDNATQKAI